MSEQLAVPPDADLEKQLDAYSAAAQAHAAPDATRWWRSWAPYAAALGSGLALNTAAEADYIVSGTIAYSGLQNRTVRVNRSGSNSASSKLVTMGTVNFHLGIDFFRFTSGSFGAVRLAGPSNSISGGPLNNASYSVVRLGANAPISAGAGPFGIASAIHQVFVTPSQTFVEGTWPSGQSGFAGVRFKSGNGAFHYGWVRLQWTDPANFPSELTAIDWAYNETPDAPILAGEGASPQFATPEPSSMALALMAAGSAGVLAWRRRRHEVAADGKP